MKKGFTLIELLVVIAIIGILATVVIVNVAGARSRSVDSKAVSDLANAAKIVTQCGNSDAGTVQLTTGAIPSGAICNGATDAVGNWPELSATAKGSSGTAWTYTAAQSTAYDSASGTFAFGADSGANNIRCNASGCAKTGF